MIVQLAEARGVEELILQGHDAEPLAMTREVMLIHRIRFLESDGLYHVARCGATVPMIRSGSKWSQRLTMQLLWYLAHGCQEQLVDYTLVCAKFMFHGILHTFMFRSSRGTRAAHTDPSRTVNNG